MTTFKTKNYHETWGDTYTSISVYNDRAALMFVLPPETANSNDRAYGTMFVMHTDPEIKSKNYSTVLLAEHGPLKLLSRNSPSFVGGHIYLDGAFRENDGKPYMFPLKDLRRLYPQESYIDTFHGDLFELMEKLQCRYK